MEDLAIKIANKNDQLTDIKLSLQSEPKIKAGRQNVATNLEIPFDSLVDIKLNLKIK